MTKMARLSYTKEKSFVRRKKNLSTTFQEIPYLKSTHTYSMHSSIIPWALNDTTDWIKKAKCALLVFKLVVALRIKNIPNLMYMYIYFEWKCRTNLCYNTQATIKERYFLCRLSYRLFHFVAIWLCGFSLFLLVWRRDEKKRTRSPFLLLTHPSWETLPRK